MRVGAHNGFDLPACGTPQALQVLVVGGARVDGDVAGVRVTHQITVGAGAGHHPGVGGREALHVLQQRDGLVGLPVQVVVDLLADSPVAS